MLFGTILYGLGQRAPSVDRRGDVFMVAMAGFLASCLIQQNGWSYRPGDGMARLGGRGMQRMTGVQSRAQWAGSILTAAWAGQFILVAVLGGPYRNGVADR